MASLGRLGGLGGGVKAEPAVTKPLGKLVRVWEITKILIRNEFTRGFGRDVLMFGASVVLIRLVMSIMAEQDGGGGPAALPATA